MGLIVFHTSTLVIQVPVLVSTKCTFNVLKLISVSVKEQ